MDAILSSFPVGETEEELRISGLKILLEEVREQKRMSYGAEGGADGRWDPTIRFLEVATGEPSRR